MRPINNLEEMCPCLIELRVTKFLSEVNPTDTWVQSYPQTLQVISIPFGEIFESGSNSDVSSVSGVSATSHISMATGKNRFQIFCHFTPKFENIGTRRE